MSPVRFGVVFLIVYVVGFAVFSWLIFGAVSWIALAGGVAGVVIALLAISYFRSRR